MLEEVISVLRDYGVVVSTKSVVNPGATENARAGRIAQIVTLSVAALSRLKHGFESRRERQLYQHLIQNASLATNVGEALGKQTAQIGIVFEISNLTRGRWLASLAPSRQ